MAAPETEAELKQPEFIVWAGGGHGGTFTDKGIGRKTFFLLHNKPVKIADTMSAELAADLVENGVAVYSDGIPVVEPVMEVEEAEISDSNDSSN